MLTKLQDAEKRFEDIEAALADPETMADMEK